MKLLATSVMKHKALCQRGLMLRQHYTITMIAEADTAKKQHSNRVAAASGAPTDEPCSTASEAAELLRLMALPAMLLGRRRRLPVGIPAAETVSKWRGRLGVQLMAAGHATLQTSQA